MAIPASLAIDFIRAFHRSAYEEEIMAIAQQAEPKLWMIGDPIQLRGKETNYDRYDSIVVTERTTRFADTPESDTARRRRLIVGKVWEYHERFDIHFDSRQTMRERLDDPELRRNIVKSFARNRDDLWADAIDAVSAEFDSDAGSAANVAFGEATPGVPLVPSHDLDWNATNPVGGEGGMSVPKIIVAKRILDGKDVDEDNRHCALHSIQMSQLNNDNQWINRDFGHGRLNENAMVGMLGFEFSWSNRINAVADVDPGAATVPGHHAYFLNKRAMKSGTYRGFQVLMTSNPEAGHRLLLSHYETAQAQRAFEEDVLRIDCADVIAATV